MPKKTKSNAIKVIEHEVKPKVLEEEVKLNVLEEEIKLKVLEETEDKPKPQPKKTKAKSVSKKLDDKPKDEDIISSQKQTKNWRKKCPWYINGKKNECEKYQKEHLIKNLKLNSLYTTNIRLNINTFELKFNSSPMKENDGFEWTEDFDGHITKDGREYYINLKMVCDKGGSQTRTNREVYHFIKCQLEHLKKFKTTNIYFINILDGNGCFAFKNQYNFIKEKTEYKDVLKYLYIGDMCDFIKEDNKKLIKII